LSKIKAYIECEHPNNAIYKFEGNIKLDGISDSESPSKPMTVSLGADNVLLRGMNLRNT